MALTGTSPGPKRQKEREARRRYSRRAFFVPSRVARKVPKTLWVSRPFITQEPFEMTKLRNYVCGNWVEGEGVQSTLHNPATGDEICTVSAVGVDRQAALAYLRDIGGPVLRAMTFAERGALLERMSKSIHAHREELMEIGRINCGNTRSDAKFDLDGATGTLMTYARMGKELGDARHLNDGEPTPMGSSSRMQGHHVRMPRQGVAICINAFNFPAWGFGEKAACAILAGVPVLTKPATVTAQLAHRVFEILIEEADVPEGVLALLVGPAGDLLDHVDFQDVVAFTGSAATGSLLRSHPAVLKTGARMNVEADSLNVAVLAGDLDEDAEAFDLFVRDLTTEMRQKAGQKCTATRRVLVPHNLLDSVIERVGEEISRARIGDPADKDVRIGPLAALSARDDTRAALDELLQCTEVVVGDPNAPLPDGAFMAPLVLKATDPDADNAVHNVEVFGPVTTLLPYDGTSEVAARLMRLGKGGLVASFYTDDRAFAEDLINRAAAFSGRIIWGSKKVAGSAPTPGVVWPQFIHGGPGRAGGGEELGGLRGLELFTQRVAVQGYGPVLDRILG